MKRYEAILEGLNESRKRKKPNESLTGTEIGLPIDKENCEGTDASMVSTPNGKVGKRKDDNAWKCPKCHSENVNIFDDNMFHCSSCEYKWKIDDGESDGEIVI